MPVLDRLLLKITADSSELEGQMRQAGAIVASEGRRIESSWDGVRRGVIAVRDEIARVAAAYLGIRAAIRLVDTLAQEAVRTHADLAAQADAVDEAWDQFKRTSADVLQGPLALTLEWSELFLVNLRKIELGWSKAFTTTGPERLAQATADLAEAQQALSKAKAQGDDPDRPGFIAMQRKVAELEALVESLRSSPASFVDQIAPIPFAKPAAPTTSGGAKPRQPGIVLAPLGASRMEQILGGSEQAREDLRKLEDEAKRTLDRITDVYLGATGDQEEVLRRGIDKQLADIRGLRDQGLISEQEWAEGTKELHLTLFAELDQLDAERTAAALRQAGERIQAAHAEAEEFRQAFSSSIGEIKSEFETMRFSIKRILSAIASDLAGGLFERGSNALLDAIFTPKDASSTSGGGGLFDTLFGGLFKAQGGPVMANVPAIVGEKGPELFVPNVPGIIVPNDRFRSGGGGNGVAVYNTFVLNPGAGVEAVAMLHREGDRIRRDTVATIIDQQRRSGGRLL